jgi:hypothetical protein
MIGGNDSTLRFQVFPAYNRLSESIVLCGNCFGSSNPILYGIGDQLDD